MENVITALYCDSSFYSVIGPEFCLIFDIMYAKTGTEAVAESFYRVMRFESRGSCQSFQGWLVSSTSDSMWTGSHRNGVTLHRRWQGQRSQATPRASLQGQEIMEKKWRWSVQSGKKNCKRTRKISFPSVTFLSRCVVSSAALVLFPPIFLTYEWYNRTTH